MLFTEKVKKMNRSDVFKLGIDEYTEILETETHHKHKIIVLEKPAMNWKKDIKIALFILYITSVSFIESSLGIWKFNDGPSKSHV